jgi:hypothetical protein
MRTDYLRGFITAIAFGLLFTVGLNQDTYGQGKGHGGGNPHGGPPGQQQRGGGPPPGRGGGNGGGMQQRQQPQQVYRQQPQPQQVFRQQQYRMPPGQARRQERVYQQPAPRQVWRQPQQVWRQQERQQAFRMPPGQARKQERQAYVQGPVFQSPGRGNGRGRQQRENVAPPWVNGGFVPPGQIRSAEVHERNAIRKAERQQQEFYRRYQRDYGRGYREYQGPYYAPYVPAPVYQYNQPYDYQQYSYVQPYYPSYLYYSSPAYFEPYQDYGGGYLVNSPLYVPNTFLYEPYTAYSYYPDYYGYAQPYYGYDNGYGFDWKSILVRTLIGFVLGNENNDYYGLQPYDPYYGYAPAVYDSGYGYGGYYPASYAETVYVQPYYDYSGYQAPLVNYLPMQDLFGPSYGGYSSDTLREVLAQGYEQGYQAGWYARENQLRNDYLDRDYVINDDYIDPYSYSIGENRRCFTEGYNIGYQDALNGRHDYISQYSGNTDLVSLLLSNVIGNI